MLSPLCRYIGSLEDLKSKFGTSYHLELKMAEVGHSDAVHTEILKLFPHAARQERSVSMGCPHQDLGWDLLFLLLTLLSDLPRAQLSYKPLPKLQC